MYSPFGWIPPNIQTRCAEESQAPAEFEQTVDIAVAFFIFGFKNCKARLLSIMPYLELQFLQFGNSDEEVGAFSSDED